MRMRTSKSIMIVLIGQMITTALIIIWALTEIL